MEVIMREKLIVKLIVASLVVVAWIALTAAKQDKKENLSSLQQEGNTLRTSVVAAKDTVQQLASEATKSKDIKWRVCVQDVYGTVKGLLVSATRAQKQLENAAILQKGSVMKSALVLLRGLSESAEKAVADATACTGQISTINTKTTTKIDTDKKKTGGGDSVNDAMGVGFSGDLVAGRDNSTVSDSGISDSAGSDSETQTDTPDNNGESTGMTDSMDAIITTPEIVDASPTR